MNADHMRTAVQYKVIAIQSEREGSPFAGHWHELARLWREIARVFREAEQHR